MKEILPLILKDKMSAGKWKDMFLAVQQNDIELLKYHIKNKVDLNYQHPEFMTTALVESIRHNHAEITHCLLQNGANPKLKEVFGGHTPMSMAETVENDEIIKLLLIYL
jgi:ankyrin repeat protein